MAAIALAPASAIVRDNVGSFTQILISVVTISTSDTYNLGVNLPVFNVDVQGDSVIAGSSNSGDATYSSTTGLITIVSQNQGPITLVIWLRS